MNDIQNLRTFAYAQHFLEFYSEVSKLKRSVEQQGSTDPAFAGHAPASVDSEFIIQRLQALLEAQALLVGRRSSDFVAAQFREAQYVMAALADDIFLYGLEWRGRETWRENVLEYRLFKTRYAGERIFDNIEAILRNQDRRQEELAPIYILALSLGFKGRYRRPEDRSIIEDYANRLFEFVFDHPADMHAPGRRFIPQAYDHTVAGAPPKGGRLRASWPLALAATVGAFLVISQIMWLAMTHDIDRAIDRVIETAAPEIH
jgi:type VI secretion system protein ImpK